VIENNTATRFLGQAVCPEARSGANFLYKTFSLSK
jgi:hypothetical protein